MGETMKRICSICARGGSKGVKNKNIRDFLGKPLIAHTIRQARETGLFELVAVSSDSQAILDTARNWGADILINRPAELATDTAAKLPVIQHCMIETEKKAGFQCDVIVDLDATAPLRTVDDICGAVRLLESNNVSNVITGAPARKSPYFNLVEMDGEGFVHLSKPPNAQIFRRQDAPACYDMNASIYVWQREALLRQTSIFDKDTMLYVMPEDRSIDIDSELEFELVEFIANKRRKDYE
jgi:N-acylneuraminate cytidylyltransferase/CMP-N,N'-diacetyllegionaminic acid synthase